MKSKPYHSVKTRRGLEDVADDVLSQFVRLRDKYCVLCGSPRNLTAGHFVKRRFESTRWLACNVHALCAPCNAQDNEDHLPYTLFMLGTYTTKELAALEELKQHGGKVSDDELKELIRTTKAAIKTLKGTA